MKKMNSPTVYSAGQSEGTGALVWRNSESMYIGAAIWKAMWYPGLTRKTIPMGVRQS